MTKNVEDAVKEFEEIVKKSGLDYVYVPLPE